MEDDMAVKAKKKVASKKAATSPKPKVGVKKVAATSGELEKAIIAVNEIVERLGKKIDKSFTVMTARMTAYKEEADARMAASKEEADARMAASKEEADAKIAEANARMAASFDRLERVVEETKAQLSGLSDSAGRAVESLACSFFDSRMTFAGVKFDYVEIGVNRRSKLPDGTRIQGEYDVVLYNGSAIALIEAKNRVRRSDVTKLINEQMPRFKQLFPQYKDFKYYLGLCGMSFEDGVEKEALDMGIGTLKPNGDAVEINETTVKAW
jgi:hypothetical protein